MTVSSELVVAVLALIATLMFGYETWRSRVLGWAGLAILALAFLLHAVSVRVTP